MTTGAPLTSLTICKLMFHLWVCGFPTVISWVLVGKRCDGKIKLFCIQNLNELGRTQIFELLELRTLFQPKQL